MSGIGGFLRGYEFLNLTKSVTESQMALYKKPNETWSQIGSKLYSICWYNSLSVAAVGADVATYMAVSTLRNVGLFCPRPPEPPVFPAPHDNVQFVDCAIKRALWDWDLWARKEIEEGIESSLSEKWNIFQLVGEWSFAYSLENMERSSYFKPTFLRISEPLENGASFRSISSDFSRLWWPSEKKAILEALYHQSTPPALGPAAKKVYQDIRAIASKLHQGNQNYLTAFSEYVNKKSAAAPSIPPPSHAPVSLLRSAPSMIDRDVEVQMASNVAFLRNTLTGLPNARRIKTEILSDQTNPSDPASLKNLSARLALLKAFESASDRPEFLPWKQKLASGKTFPQAVQDFAMLKRADFIKLQGALTQPSRGKDLSAPLKMRLRDLNAFGEILSKSKDFLKIYEALRIDLLIK